jgi:hypothetical protein
MGWQNEEDRKLAIDLIKKGHGNKEILDALQNRCVKGDLGNLRYNLKKEGAISGKRRQSSQKNPAKSKSHKGNGLDKEIEQERARLTAEIDKQTELITCYNDKTEFVCYLETKLERNKKKLKLLEEIAAL